MLSINTNLSSLITQNSMKTSTDKLNQAIEKMTTGFKINHAKDNAANYSISTNLTTQLSAYDTAADNVAMGMDLVNYASDIISQMQDKAARLNALSTQARNGTYGAQSLSALNSEASAIMSELMRLYSTAEYNDISLFNRKEYELTAEHKALTETVCAKEEYNGFIADPVTKEQSYVDALTSVSSVTQLGGFTESEYKVASVEDLVKLAELTNAGVNTSGKTFYLANDLDIGAYCEAHMADGGWTPIGDYSTDTSYIFKGTFDGNGHVIKNLKIDRETSDYQGLFGCTKYGEIKNIGIINAKITGKSFVGGIIGVADNGVGVNNCFAIADIIANKRRAGGISGETYSIMTDCYVIGNVQAQDSFAGGLTGFTNKNITDSFVIASVKGVGNVGGISGQSAATISNCYSDGDVTAQKYVGALAGIAEQVLNCYTVADVEGSTYVGGLVGLLYAYTGTSEITNSASYSRVVGEDLSSTGSLIGGAVMTQNGTDFGILNISNSQSRTIDVMNKIGGAFHYNSTAIIYDFSSALAGISDVKIIDTSTNLQVGIYSNDSSRMNFNTNFEFEFDMKDGIESEEVFNSILQFENLLSERATQLGAIQNRLDSALESIEVNINNLTSTRSTIRDADIAEVSSQYIQQQILQQAAATLMATANQSPSIALQLI